MSNRTQITAEPGKQELFITREFDAPRELVFRAYTEPELYAQWLGPNGLSTEFETFQPHSGGSWRFVQTDASGNRFPFHGVNHDVTAPERIIGTFEFDGLGEPGHVLLETTRFEELPGGRSRIVAHSVYQSVADRDGMIQSGMERGVVEGFDRLDQLLRQLARA